MIRSRWAVLFTVLAVLAGVMGAPIASATSRDPGDVGIAARFRSQALQWQPCFPQVPPGLPPGTERLECSVVRAPLDWHHQDRGTVDLAVSRLRPVGTEPVNLLLTNPGGPGEEGLIVPLLFLDPAHSAVAESSEIVGVDVRGTGRSTTITCGGSVIGRERDVRDRSGANVSAMLDSAENQAKACQQESEPVGDFITTAQTVKDFDLIRTLLGHSTVNWFGFSAGTWLGAHYATAYPSRAGRFVFDSNTLFTGTWQQFYALQPMGFERRFRQDFLPWAAKYDALYDLGSTGEQVRGSYERIRAFLAEHPQHLGDQILYAGTLDSIVAGNLYSKRNFLVLAQLLAQLKSVSGPPPAKMRFPVSVAEAAARAKTASRLPGAKAGAPDAVDATFYTIGCNDTRWYGNRGTLTVSSGIQGRLFPLIGWRTIAEPCVFWQRPAGEELPKPTGRGVPSVLMIQSTHDPATPWEGAQLAHANFAGSRLLPVVGEGDHMLYGSGNPCVDHAVDSYLAADTLPPRDASCAGTALPDPMIPGTGSGNTDTVGLPRLATLAGVNR
ncbi:alpha/beta hydrolase [Amycolatopsis sp. GA6-003]|uniref:alpha/beta hydrolase n=1 Tax=Amycolatopsis sp. GA6-003 TaxID=2652444 RepID=UPI0039173FE7